MAMFTPVLNDTDATQKHIIARGTITIAAGSYTTGGVAIDFTTLIPNSSIPFPVWFGSSNGYSYSYVPGTTQANGKLKICTAAATELTAAALPAGVTGDVVTFEADFNKA